MGKVKIQIAFEKTQPFYSPVTDLLILVGKHDSGFTSKNAL